MGRSNSGVVMSGREFKEFYNDSKWWGSVVHYGETIEVNGKVVNTNVGAVIFDGAEVRIRGGFVESADGKGMGTLVGYYKKWLRMRGRMRHGG
jgi:hypothetical protein